jgi:ATP-binding cassette, subfamily G (WHITE), member 2, SNQ2
MLDVIGAGATATSTIDWHDAWKKSAESSALRADLDRIHEEGRSRPPIAQVNHGSYASSWFFQFYNLYMRANRQYWREPSYLFSKLALNIAGVSWCLLPHAVGRWLIAGCDLV